VQSASNWIERRVAQHRHRRIREKCVSNTQGDKEGRKTRCNGDRPQSNKALKFRIAKCENRVPRLISAIKCLPGPMGRGPAAGSAPAKSFSDPNEAAIAKKPRGAVH
jgi:hypothetical protein